MREDRDGAEAARRYQVAVMGASECGPELTALAEELGQRLIDAGFRIVCGGRGGVMIAVCRGARRSTRYREGDTIGILPTLERGRANPFVDVVLPTPMGYARNALVACAGHVAVAVAGGSGTLSEVALAWQFDVPVVALDTGEGWSSRLAGERLDTRREDRVHRANSPEDVIVQLQQILGEGQADRGTEL